MDYNDEYNVGAAPKGVTYTDMLDNQFAQRFKSDPYMASYMALLPDIKAANPNFDPENNPGHAAQLRGAVVEYQRRYSKNNFGKVEYSALSGAEKTAFAQAVKQSPTGVVGDSDAAIGMLRQFNDMYEGSPELQEAAMRELGFDAGTAAVARMAFSRGGGTDGVLTRLAQVWYGDYNVNKQTLFTNTGAKNDDDLREKVNEAKEKIRALSGVYDIMMEQSEKPEQIELYVSNLAKAYLMSDPMSRSDFERHMQNVERYDSSGSDFTRNILHQGIGTNDDSGFLTKSGSFLWGAMQAGVGIDTNVRAKFAVPADSPYRKYMQVLAERPFATFATLKSVLGHLEPSVAANKISEAIVGDADKRIGMGFDKNAKRGDILGMFGTGILSAAFNPRTGLITLDTMLPQGQLVVKPEELEGAVKKTQTYAHKYMVDNFNLRSSDGHSITVSIGQGNRPYHTFDVREAAPVLAKYVERYSGAMDDMSGLSFANSHPERHDDRYKRAPYDTSRKISSWLDEKGVYKDLEELAVDPYGTFDKTFSDEKQATYRKVMAGIMSLFRE